MTTSTQINIQRQLKSTSNHHVNSNQHPTTTSTQINIQRPRQLESTSNDHINSYQHPTTTSTQINIQRQLKSTSNDHVNSNTCCQQRYLIKHGIYLHPWFINCI